MNDSLGRFDEILRGEREQIARDRDAQARDANAGGEGAGGETPGGDTGTPGARDGDMKGDMPSGESADEAAKKDAPPGDMQSDSNSKGANSGTGSGSSKGKNIQVDGKPIPNGSDDDIIARQIREAAEKETDPELKDKLWREYVEYKKNAKK